MRNYIVTRHGSNASNQSMCQSLDIGLVSAPTRQIAFAKAIEKYGDDCFSNQHLTVVAEGRVGAERWNTLLENLAMSA